MWRAVGLRKGGGAQLRNFVLLGIDGQLGQDEAQLGVLAAVSGAGGLDVPSGAEMLPVDPVPGVDGELADERSLGATVALPERVGGVDLGEVVGQPVDQRLAGEAVEVLLAGSCASTSRR